MPEKPKRKTAMISSTSLDLPEHRQQAMNACLRQGIFPNAMEHLPARDTDAIRVSLEMVDEADIYLGIYAWRYGHVPEGHDISVTEMEFNRAVERGIPILVFTMHDDHHLTRTMVEADRDAQEKLTKLKERACQGRGRLEFKSPVDLRSYIIQSLGALLKEEEAASQEKRAPSLHPPNLIPTAPAPYIAHPYSLLQTSEVVGRREELHRLTDWVTANTIMLSADPASQQQGHWAWDVCQGTGDTAEKVCFIFPTLPAVGKDVLNCFKMDLYEQHSIP